MNKAELKTYIEAKIKEIVADLAEPTCKPASDSFRHLRVNAKELAAMYQGAVTLAQAGNWQDASTLKRTADRIRQHQNISPRHPDLHATRQTAIGALPTATKPRN